MRCPATKPFSVTEHRSPGMTASANSGISRKNVFPESASLTKAPRAFSKTPQHIDRMHLRFFNDLHVISGFLDRPLLRSFIPMRPSGRARLFCAPINASSSRSLRCISRLSLGPRPLNASRSTAAVRPRFFKSALRALVLPNLPGKKENDGIPDRRHHEIFAGRNLYNGVFCSLLGYRSLFRR